MVPGLTQNELAEFLGVSRSLVYFAELGRRELPKDAEKKLQALQLKLESWKRNGKANNRQLDELKDQVKEAVANVADKIADCSYRAERLQRKLKKDKEIYVKHVSAMAVNSIISDKLKKGRASVKEAEWLKNHDVSLAERLEKNNPVVHAMIQLQIDLLMGQQKVYERFVEDNK